MGLRRETASDRPIKGLSEDQQEKIFDDLAHRIEELAPARSVALEIPPEYLKWLEARYAGIELLGQDIQQGLAIKLSHMYVPALTQPAPVALDAAQELQKEVEEILEIMAPSAQDPEQARLREVEEKRSTLLLHRIDQASLYVPAPAGGGKSTFCRWAVLQSIPGTMSSHPVPAPKEYEEPVPESLRARLPLLVPLRDFGKDMDCGCGRRTWHRSHLEQALAAWIDRSPPPGLSGTLVRDHLMAGSVFLLLDGLDEVAVSEAHDGATVYPRALLLSGLADALPVWEAAGNRTLLTSRPYGLDEAGLGRLGFPRAPLEPMPEQLQKLFVRRWFHTLKREKLAGELLEAMGSRDDLAPLTENPMLLTAMCVLYDKGGGLPEDRYELYKSIVDGVLHSRYPGDAREREPVLRRLEAIAYGMHTGEPDEAPRQTPAAEISWNETERLLAHFAERNPSFGQGEVAAAVQHEELLTRSGLLLPRPNERAAFYHLSFQEFLAAQRIARGSEKRVTEVIDARVAVSEWRPTLLFLFAAQLFSKDPEWRLDLLGRLLEGQDRAAVQANPASAVFIAEALELCLAKRYQIPEALAESFRRLSLRAIEDEVDVHARQTLALCLGRLGDPRIFDLRDSRAYVAVPTGTYPYSETGETVEITAPFWIGRYPVTNSQYRAFLEDGGYGNREWWSDAGWSWLRKKGVTEPGGWRETRWNGPNQPVPFWSRGLLRLGRRTPAVGAGMGGRRRWPGGL